MNILIDKRHMSILRYYYIVLIACSLILQASWASGEPGGKIKVDPQSLPICTIEEAEGEDPEDENSNKYAIFEPEKIKLRGNSLLLSWSRRSRMQDTNWTKRKSTNGPLRKSWKSKMEIRTLVLSIRLTRNSGEK